LGHVYLLDLPLVSLGDAYRDVAQQRVAMNPYDAIATLLGYRGRLVRQVASQAAAGELDVGALWDCHIDIAEDRPRVDRDL
jgi:hypothetical protein